MIFFLLWAGFGWEWLWHNHNGNPWGSRVLLCWRISPAISQQTSQWLLWAWRHRGFLSSRCQDAILILAVSPQNDWTHEHLRTRNKIPKIVCWNYALIAIFSFFPYDQLPWNEWHPPQEKTEQSYKFRKNTWQSPSWTVALQTAEEKSHLWMLSHSKK